MEGITVSNASQEQNGQMSKSTVNLDTAIAEARMELSRVEKRRRELRKVIRDFTDLKQRKMPVELFQN